MYEAFYGLTEEPFNITPDPKFFYLSKKHEGGLEHLLYGIERKKGLIVLTGEVGTGKTTLLNTIIQRIDDKAHIAFLINSQVSPLDIYKYIFYEFNLDTDFSGKTEGDILILLKNFLNRCLIQEENCILIIDEAQNLSHDVLEKVRLLLNFETYDKKLIQVILVGHPDLNEKLNMLESAKLRQRISISYHLLPLDYTETKGYIEKRLIVAGARKPIFTDDAITEIYRCSQGIPRLINIVCDLALFIGFGKKQPLLDRDILLQAEQMLHMKEAPIPTMPGLTAPVPPTGLFPQPTAGAATQGMFTPMAGQASQAVLADFPPLFDHAASAPVPQATPRSWSVWWPVFGGIAAGMVLSLLFWSGFVQSSANLPHGIAGLAQSVQHLVLSSPATPQPPTHSAAEPVRLQPAEPLVSAPSSAALPSAPPVLPLESRSEPEAAHHTTPPSYSPSPAETPTPPPAMGAVDRPPVNTPGLLPVVALPAPFPEPYVIVVRAGDTLGEIILRHYKRLDNRLLTVVQEANPEITNPARISIGQVIALPSQP
jgi:general secretion pathway protein A